MNHMKEKLILFTRYPVPGQAKTRLIPELGKEEAARLQELMTGYAVLKARCCVAAHNVKIEIRFDGGSRRNMCRWLGDGLEYVPQGKGDLGQRMERAFREAFEAGYERVAIIGCDCPEMKAQYLSDAFDTLKENDMVIGPAVDGGYYLIALRVPAPELFIGINWGSESVFEQTMKIAKSEGLQIAELKKLSDVDRPEDLSLCHNLRFFNSSSDTISVLMAALNEESHIEMSISGALHGALEVFLADGGSQDKTVELAQQSGATILTVPYGRSAQLNTAALNARGDILLFLHADTVLPETYAADILKTLKQPGIAAGAFRLGINSDRLGIRLVESLTNLRSKWLQLPYGDQAIFMRRDVFLRLGGFSGLPIMEDYELVRRLQRQGRVATLAKQVRTSARRWLKLGILRTTLINQLMIAGYWLGISPNRLARFYRNKKSHLKTKAKGKGPKYESTLLRTK